jgi:hypothetical protein
VTILGQFTRQIGADAAGRAGDESEGASVACHDNGSELNKPVEATGILEFATPVILHPHRATRHPVDWPQWDIADRRERGAKIGSRRPNRLACLLSHDLSAEQG